MAVPRSCHKYEETIDRTEDLVDKISSIRFLTPFIAAAALLACGQTDSNVGKAQAAVHGAACGQTGRTSQALDGCNSCTCTDEGTWACTRAACAAGCEAGSTRPAGDGCNTCVCEEDGSWSCSEMACEVTCEYDGVIYSPGDGFPSTDGCNSCGCQETGQVACTLKACIDPGVACSPGEQRPADDGCNSCTCTDEGTWACTEMACEEGCFYGGQRYAVGDGFPSTDGCNSCSCVANGRVACTLMACLECPPPAPQDPGMACITVVVWAKNPESGSCCMYPDPCSAPGGWRTFYNEAECGGASE